MKNNLAILMGIILCSILACKEDKESAPQTLVAINPLSYTAVVYTSLQDTVMVATYSGRIARRIKGQPTEKVIVQLQDEVYSLQYSQQKDLIIASTLGSGILFIDVATGRLRKQLPLEQGTWINSLLLSKDETYLAGMDVKGKNHIWDLSQNYQSIDFSKELPNSYLRYIDEAGFFYYQTRGKYIKWNPKEKRIEKEIKIQGRLVDVDKKDNLLLLNFNEFSHYNIEQTATTIREKHPYSIYQFANGDTAHDPYQLKLTDARFTSNHIYTCGLDQTIRVWDKNNGSLVDEWYTHIATISEMDISPNQKQLVSIDLKGGIEFWDLP